MYNQLCWITGQLDNLPWEDCAKFLLSLCGQMWVGREGVYLHSLRIQPALFWALHCWAGTDSRRLAACQEPASSDMAQLQAEGLNMWEQDSSAGEVRSTLSNPCCQNWWIKHLLQSHRKVKCRVAVLTAASAHLTGQGEGEHFYPL